MKRCLLKHKQDRKISVRGEVMSDQKRTQNHKFVVRNEMMFGEKRT